jgi:hypothetical protein
VECHPAELLRQRQVTSAEDYLLVVAVTFHDDLDPWSWLKLLAGHNHPADSALGIPTGCVRNGANTHELLRWPLADAASGSEGTIATGLSIRHERSRHIPGQPSSQRHQRFGYHRWHPRDRPGPAAGPLQCR